MLIESQLAPENAVLDETCLAGDPWMGVVRKGQVFRILDLEGNQAVDTLFYNLPAFLQSAGEQHGMYH